MEAPDNKIRQYSLDYLKFDFITSLSNEILPLCLVCEKTLYDDAMMPLMLKDHLHCMHAGEKMKVLNILKC